MREEILAFKETFEPKLGAFLDAAIEDVRGNSQLVWVWIAMKDYVMRGGKRLRPFLLKEVADSFDLDIVNLDLALIAFELLHNSTLADDDIADGHDTRRGAPTLPVVLDSDRVSGEHVTMLISAAVHARARLVLFDLVEPFRSEALDAFNQISLGINSAQLVDLQTARRLDLSEADLIQQIEGVTAQFIELMFRLGAPDQYKELMLEIGKNLGIVFQLVDDLMDIDGTKSKGRPVGDDIRAGKATPLSLYAYKQLKEEDAERFSTNFGRLEIDEEEMAWMIAVCHSTGAVSHVHSLVDQRLQLVITTLESLGDAAQNLNWIYDLCEYSVQRAS